MARSLASPSTHARSWRRRAAGPLLASLLLLSLAPSAQAATTTNSWLAKVGSAGANGTASMLAYTTGSGSLILKLKKLPASKTLTVTLLKTSCKGSTLLTLASIKSSSSGAATRTSSLNASQVTSVKKATTGSAKIAIRIGTGTTAKCGVFAVQPVPAYIAAKVTVGAAPSGVAVDATGVWVTNWWDNSLSRISPTTNTVLSVVPLTLPDEEGPEAITVGGGSLWVTTTEFNITGDLVAGSILRVDPVSGAVLATIPGGAGAVDIAYGLGGVWVPNFSDGTVLHIDPATNAVVATIPFPAAAGVGIDATSVWVVDLLGKVARIDPVTNVVGTPIFTQSRGGDIVPTATGVWVTHPGTTEAPTGSVSRIDPATNLVVANVPVAGSPFKLEIAGGSVWVGLFNKPGVVRINAATNAITSTVVTSAPIYSMGSTTGAVWLVHNVPIPEGATAPPVGSVSRIGF